MGKKSREKRTRVVAAPQSLPAPVQAAPLAEMPWSEPSNKAAEATDLPSWALPLAVFVFALALRAYFLVQVTHTPYLEVDNIDAKGYQAWANQILGGDWLPRRHFYQSPLYAYYLALVYAVFGTGAWAPRLLQVLSGSASCALLYLLGARLFSRRVGIIAGVMLALYGPMITEEIMLAKTSLAVFTVLLAAVLYLWALARNDLRAMVLAGAAFGLTIIGVGQWLLAWLLLAAYAWLDAPVRSSNRTSLALAFLLGGVLLVGPLAAWNSYWGGGPMLTSGDAGLNLFIGNNPLTTGLPGRPPGLRDVPEFEEADSKRLAERDAGHPLTPSQVSSHWSRRATAWATENPSAFISTTLRKLSVLWNAYEFPDSYQYSFIRELFIPSLWACLTFAVVGPLALAGMVLIAGYKRARPLYIICLGYLAVIVLFYIRARYRMPAIPFLILFAAAALDWAYSAAMQRQWSALAAAGLATVAAAAFVNHRYCEAAHGPVPEVCLGDDTFYDLEWMKLAEWHHDHGNLQLERDYLEKATKVSTLRGGGSLYFWFADSEYRLAESLAHQNQPAAAKIHYENAERAYKKVLDYKHRPAHVYNNLALVYHAAGDDQHATEAIESALQLQPGDTDILRHGVRLYVELKRCADARRLYEQMEKRAPGDPSARQLMERCAG